jgi:hypothetical protein
LALDKSWNFAITISEKSKTKKFGNLNARSMNLDLSIELEKDRENWVKQWI